MGKLKKREDGRYQTKVFLGNHPETGKPRYKYVYGSSLKEIEEKAMNVRLSLRKGLDVMAENETFEVWANRWSAIKATEVSRSWMASYKCNIKKLEPILNIPIVRIRTSDVQGVILDLATADPPPAKRTLQGVQSTAQQIFALAVENRVIDYNPALAARIPKKLPKTTRRALTEEEQQWIIDTPHRARLAALVMMYAGLRRGELIPLTWNDVDFKEQTITISKSVEKVSNCFEVKSGAKSNAGERVIPIPGILLEELAKERKQNKGVYIAHSAKGGMHTPSSWKRLWSSYLTDLNIKYGVKNRVGEKATSKFDPKGIDFMIPRITPHWLRHTYATNLYLAGVDVLTAQEWLGHADAQTTLQVYTHLTQKHKKQNAEKLDAFLQRIKS